MAFPTFLCIGPGKSGSSSLHYYLDQHPQICMSSPKETRFFDLYYAKGMQWYSERFTVCQENIIKVKEYGEASPQYFYLPFVTSRIKKNFPNIKLIVMIRNPVDRVISGWKYRKINPHYCHCG